MKLGPTGYYGSTLRERRGSGLRLTVSSYPPGQRQPWHIHAHPTLFLLLCGENCDQAGRVEHVQQAMTLVFHPTTEPHAAQVGPRGMQGLNIECDRLWLERHDLTERDLGGYRVLDAPSSRLGAVRLLATAFQRSVWGEANLQTQILELLEPLVRPVASPEPSPAPRWLRRAEDLLRDQFRLPISLRDVAEEVGIHPVHVARVFRKQHGCSVSDYVRALRLAEASRLVLQEGWSIGAAAHEAGFADHPHLCRCFSREFGFRPRLLRIARRSLQP